MSAKSVRMERDLIAAANAEMRTKRTEIAEQSMKRILAYDPEITAAALAARLGIGKSAVSAMVKRLGLELKRGQR